MDKETWKIFAELLRLAESQAEHLSELADEADDDPNFNAEAREVSRHAEQEAWAIVDQARAILDADPGAV